MALDAAVVFVSAGMFEPKKRDHALARRQLYLNYGALSLATQLELAGHCAILVHGEHRSPAEILNQLVTSRYLPSRYPLMLSIPSFYALPWAQDFARLFKRIFPGDEIIVGGRWVVGPDVDWFRDKIPEAGRLVPGLGEGVLCDLLLPLNTSMSGVRRRHRTFPSTTASFWAMRPFSLALKYLAAAAWDAFSARSATFVLSASAMLPGLPSSSNSPRPSTTARRFIPTCRPRFSPRAATGPTSLPRKSRTADLT